MNISRAMNKDLIHKVERYCSELMECSRCHQLPFHNWQHTKDVVCNSEYIAAHENLSDEDTEEIIIASYFHDTGNTDGSSEHEKKSCEYARKFLTRAKYPEQRIINVINIIKATEMPQQPITLAQKVICDADLAHLGKANFSQKNKNLRKEWDLYNHLQYTDEQWVVMNLNFLQNHNFHTSFAREHYRKQKEDNLKYLNSK